MDEAETVTREAAALFAAPQKGDLALFDGWTVWPFDKNDGFILALTAIAGLSVYEWDGMAWVKQAAS